MVRLLSNPTLIQSTQPTNQPINQLIKQSSNQLISTNHLINQPFNQPQPTLHSTNQLSKKPKNRQTRPPNILRPPIPWLPPCWACSRHVGPQCVAATRDLPGNSCCSWPSLPRLEQMEHLAKPCQATLGFPWQPNPRGSPLPPAIVWWCWISIAVTSRRHGPTFH